MSYLYGGSPLVTPDPLPAPTLLSDSSSPLPPRGRTLQGPSGDPPVTSLPKTQTTDTHPVQPLSPVGRRDGDPDTGADVRVALTRDGAGDARYTYVTGESGHGGSLTPDEPLDVRSGPVPQSSRPGPTPWSRPVPSVVRSPSPSTPYRTPSFVDPVVRSSGPYHPTGLDTLL